MAANKDMINASMVEAGFCINQHGGAYENGKANTIQVKALVAAKYFEMEDNLNAFTHCDVAASFRHCGYIY